MKQKKLNKTKQKQLKPKANNMKKKKRESKK